MRVTISGGKIAAIDILEASGETASYFASAQGVISRMIAGNTPNVDAVSGATYSSNGILDAVKKAFKEAVNPEYGKKPTPTPTKKPIPKPKATPKPMATPKPTVTPKPTETPAATPTPEPDDPDVTPVPEKPNVTPTPGTDEPDATPEPTEAPEPVGMYRDGTYTGSAFGYGGKTYLTITISGGQIASIEQTNQDTPEFLILHGARSILRSWQTSRRMGSILSAEPPIPPKGSWTLHKRPLPRRRINRVNVGAAINI